MTVGLQRGNPEDQGYFTLCTKTCKIKKINLKFADPTEQLELVARVRVRASYGRREGERGAGEQEKVDE